MTLRPMAVMVTLRDGESLKLGIRSGNFKADGTRSSGDSHGWFKVDHFRIQRIDAEDPTSIKNPLLKAREGAVYDLRGRIITNGRLPSGIYIKDGRKKLIIRK
jgi:hypothetical protein